jgi:hypothetical protein
MKQTNNKLAMKLSRELKLTHFIHKIENDKELEDWMGRVAFLHMAVKESW